MSSSAGDASPSPIPLGVSLPLDEIPLALPAPQSVLPPAHSNPRRLPPPCWSHEETIALIDAYRDKWYTLRRGNLKANHWQEVADSVGRMCPSAIPPKTSVQCRHKMEKLRKKYRTEIQRARSMPISRFSSSWVHFQRMDAMEKGSQVAVNGLNSDSDGADENEDDDDEEANHNANHQFFDQSGGFYADSNGTVYRNAQKLYNSRNGVATGVQSAAPSGGFRIRIPSGVSIAQPAPVPPTLKGYGKGNAMPPGLVSCSMTNSKAGSRVHKGEEVGKKRERDSMEEMVAAVKLLGDGFVRMEQMKMEMAREMETMRMEMEMKRTQMILDSQQRIVEAFAKAFSDKKRSKQSVTSIKQVLSPKRASSLS